MELRMRLVNALVAEEDSMTALCEEYGVSRKTGYQWLTRFRAQGPAGLAERSRSTPCYQAVENNFKCLAASSFSPPGQERSLGTNPVLAQGHSDFLRLPNALLKLNG